MSKYRKKPVVIDAFKWTGDVHQKEDPEWICKKIASGEVYFKDGNLFIKTLEGEMIADYGDYIIKGIKGEVYPCKPDIFEIIYDKL